ncbi:putative disease resistance protein RGA3 [Camellia lanceoleosa]|uniref:Disease resistance protein RGA3 n=1 Tax=Camellia lanceoleosa TaxID=1840588 RepID=A0ACC0FMC7_9ERIC|nr:putative disease resistance protein RGA3 [Camellia lanceoleosa]
MDAKEANLVGKQNLSQLQLNWEHGLAERESQGNVESEAQENIASLPASIQSLTKLQRLNIQFCDELARRCEKGKGEDWYKIAHIPQVSVIKVLPCSWVMMAAASIEVSVASDALLVRRFWAVYGSEVI